MIERFERIRQAVNTLPYNRLKLVGRARLGIIACGLSYSYTLEAIKWLGLEDKVSVLKIGTPHPLPQELVKKLLKSAAEIIIVEELEPFVENKVKAIAGEANIPVKIHGKDLLPVIGELSTRKVTDAIIRLTNTKSPVNFTELGKLSDETAPLLPWRPPTLCPGCAHRAALYAINSAARRVSRDYGKPTKPIYPGDIGCYTLGHLPPLEAVDTVICMGASIGIANGLAHVVAAPIIAHIGDSTFFHSGIPPLINAVYNKANITVAILDNSATAMTGFQPHPGTGHTATGEETTTVKIEDIAQACGVKFVEVSDPLDLQKAADVLEKAIRFKGPSVVVLRSPCVIIEQREKMQRGEKTIPYYIDQDKCNGKCDACIKLLGCPAIVKKNGETIVDSPLCTGCGICVQVCPHNAILQES
jgi:indolepyruvate ferredoxin oxidoreductase alpha subunit